MPGTAYTPFNPGGQSYVPETERWNAQRAAQMAALSQQGEIANAQLRDNAAGREWSSGESALGRQSQENLVGTFANRSAQDVQMEQLRQGGQMDIEGLRGNTQRDVAAIGNEPQMGALNFERQKYGDTRADDAPVRDIRANFLKGFSGDQGGGQQIDPDMRNNILMTILAPQMAGPAMQERGAQRQQAFAFGQSLIERAKTMGGPEGAALAEQGHKIMARSMGPGYESMIGATGGTNGTPASGGAGGNNLYSTLAKRTPAENLQNMQSFQRVNPSAIQNLVDIALNNINTNASDEAWASWSNERNKLVSMAQSQGVDAKSISDAITQAIRANVPVATPQPDYWPQKAWRWISDQPSLSETQSQRQIARSLGGAAY